MKKKRKRKEKKNGYKLHRVFTKSHRTVGIFMLGFLTVDDRIPAAQAYSNFIWFEKCCAMGEIAFTIFIIHLFIVFYYCVRLVT